MLIVWCIYFIPTSFVTLKEVKNFKSLQSYKYFTAGWVIDHGLKIFNEVCLIVGKVNQLCHVISTTKPMSHNKE